MNEGEKRQAILAGQQALEAARRAKRILPSSGTGSKWPDSWPTRAGRWAEPDQEDLDRRPADGGWTAREVVHHLADSEAQAYIRLRRLIAGAPFRLKGRELVITSSFGVTSWRPGGHAGSISFDGLMEQADEFLYQAKREGRNTVRGARAPDFDAKGCAAS